MTLVLLVVLAGLEGFAFLLFGQDKVAARGGQRRIPERTLLFAGLWGGIGAWLACVLLRHKTRKEPFRTWLGVAVIGHLIAVGAGMWWVVR